jgi:hypothetical protein
LRPVWAKESVRLVSKTKGKKGRGAKGTAQVVEYLSSMYKALGSIPSKTEREREKEGERERTESDIQDI